MGRAPTPRARARIVADRLAALYPGDAHELCALEFATPFQLLVATILSAQCTDARVNATTPALFRAFPDALSLAEADVARVEEMVRPTGFFRTKAQNLVAMAQALVSRFGGTVPEEMAELVTLPGVGRKTANVVRSVAYGLPGLPVDTHVGRLSRRLGLSAATDPVRVEADLDLLVPPAERGAFSLRLILHGRQVCTARRPRCDACALADVCPSVALSSPPLRPARSRAALPAEPPSQTPRRAPTSSSATPAHSKARPSSRSGRSAPGS